MDPFKAPAAPVPSRGALAGVKADLQRAKEGGVTYDPRGVGAAWSHNFLNQKPWHPLNFRNQIRKFEAEQKAEAEKKAKERAKAEFDSEQEYFKTLSYLSPQDQARYKEVQSVSFMYTKPPGLDAALAREAEQASKKAAAEAANANNSAKADGKADHAGGASGQVVAQQQQPEAGRHKGDDTGSGSSKGMLLERVKQDPYTAMLAARMALAQNDRLALKASSEVHGGFDPHAENQQYLVDEPEAVPSTSGGAGAGVDDEGVLGGSGISALLALPQAQQLAALKALARAQRRKQKEQEVAAAEAVLRAAGIDVDALVGGGTGGKQAKHSKRKRKSKSKKSKKHKRHKDKDKEQQLQREASKHDNGDSGTDSSSDEDSSSSGSDGDGGCGKRR